MGTPKPQGNTEPSQNGFQRPVTAVQQDISDIYLLAKETRGVFVNIALQEPFGLTLIEAAVHGAPIVNRRG